MNKEIEMKKLFTILIIMSILSFFVGARSSLAYNNISLNISDNVVGRSAELVISINSQVSIKKGEKIDIQFEGALVNDNKNFLENISVNGKSPNSALTIATDIIEILSPVDINQGGLLSITMNKGIFINSYIAGFYKLALIFNNSQYYTYCHIVDNSNMVNNVSLRVLDNGFAITFNVGEKGNLTQYHTETEQVTIQGTTYSLQNQVRPGDYICVKFSPLLSKALPSSLTFREVTINGTLPYLDPITTIHFKNTQQEEEEFKIYIPNEIRSYGDVVIVFKGLYENIQIPIDLSGDAFVGVWTSKQTTVVNSNIISVQGSYVTKTNYEISPSEPDGENGFYDTTPAVTLTSEKGSLIESINTYYKIDDGSFTLYQEPFVISQGIHNVQFHSVGVSNGKEYNEEVQSINFKIDTEPPKVSILSPLEATSRLYKLHLSIEDANIKTVKVQIQGITYTFFGNDVTLPMLLFSSSTQINVTAIDLAGNESTSSYTINLVNK